MTADELKGKSDQAAKMARSELVVSAGLKACTPEAHRGVVTILGALLDIAEAQTSFFANGFSTQVAREVNGKRQLVIGGWTVPLPTPAAVWRAMILAAALFSPGVYDKLKARGLADAVPSVAVVQEESKMRADMRAMMREELAGALARTNAPSH